MLSILMIILPSISGTPITYKSSTSCFQSIGEDQCPLPPELGNVGFIKFLEECDSLGEKSSPNFRHFIQTIFTFYVEMIKSFPTVPVSSFGVHPMICCPHTQSPICFEKDPHPWCRSVTKPEYSCDEEQEESGDYYDYGHYDYDYPMVQYLKVL